MARPGTDMALPRNQRYAETHEEIMKRYNALQ
jgi:hypothetical protein